MKKCRDVCEIFIKGKLLRSTKKQLISTDPAEFETSRKMVDKVRSRHYISGGTVLILTAYFYVLKGEYDIRLVYDITALILNDALWSLKFWIPLLDNVLDVATHLSWFGDIDAEEMFHKYKILESMQP